MRRSVTCGLLLALVWALPAAAHPVGDPDVAALQVGLKNRGFYGGTVDGAMGAATDAALRRFQVRTGLAPDGLVSMKTKLALGHLRQTGLARAQDPARRRLRLGRCGAAVPARLAGLPLGCAGRPPRQPDGHRAAQVPALGRDHARRPGRSGDGRRPARGAAALSGRAEGSESAHTERGLRTARQPLPHGRGLPRTGGHSGSRGRRRPRRPLGTHAGRLGQGRRARPRTGAAHVVRPPLGDAGPHRRERGRRRRRRPRRSQRASDRPAPPLRGPAPGSGA